MSCHTTKDNAVLAAKCFILTGFSPVFAAQTNILSNHRVRCKGAKGLQFFVETMVYFHKGRDALV